MIPYLGILENSTKLILKQWICTLKEQSKKYTKHKFKQYNRGI